MTVHLRKVIDIALKDLIRSFRNVFGLVMMFLVPILLTAMLYFAFGTLFRGDGGFDVPLTSVQVANLDVPSPQLGGFSAGQILLEFLQDESLSDLLQVSEASDEAGARGAVKKQIADVAIIVPSDFTAAVLKPDGTARVTLVQDPTLTLGPSIVEGLVSQLADTFSGAKIAAGTVARQFGQRGVPVKPQMFQDIATEYATWAAEVGQARADGMHPALDVQAPLSKAEPRSWGAEVAGLVMVGMMIFFAFFTGANTAGTIISEQENGTLARLFTTPTTHTAILGGKFTGVFVTVLVQVLVLTLLTTAIFGVHWGMPLTVSLAVLALVIVVSGFGIFIISFIRTTRQQGSVLGSVLTLAGMAGGLFTTSLSTPPRAFEIIQLLTPHGWALRAWKLALAGASAGEVALPVVVLLGMGAVFFAIGALRFRKRFA